MWKGVDKIARAQMLMNQTPAFYLSVTYVCTEVRYLKAVLVVD